MTLSNVFHDIWMLWAALWQSGLGFILLALPMILGAGIRCVTIMILLITGKDPGDTRLPRPLWNAYISALLMFGLGIALLHQGQQLMAAR